MRTVKYFIEFSNVENSMGKMEVTKKMFNEQLKYLREQVETTKDYEYPIEERVYKNEYEKTISTCYIFTCACADTVLEKLECKEGYCFTK